MTALTSLISAYRIQAFIYLILPCLLIRCVDPYATSLAEGGGRMLVEGRIHEGEGPYYVKIGRIPDYGSLTPTPEMNARVILYDGEGRSEEAVEVETGLYVFAGEKVQGRTGQSYRLRIELTDGEIIHSSEEIMPPRVVGDSLQFRLETASFSSESGLPVSDRVIRLYVHTATRAFAELPGPYLRWETSEMFMFPELDHPDPRIYPNTCYITKATEQNPIRLYSRRQNPVDRWEGQLLVQRRLNWEFEHKHYFTVLQISTTEANHQYWSNVDQIVRQQGSLLDPPPAAIIGNLYSETNPVTPVLGYFEAVSIDSMRVFTLKTDMQGFNFRPFCVQDYSRYFYQSFGYPPACYACWQLPGSSFKRPSWW